MTTTYPDAPEPDVTDDLNKLREDARKADNGSVVGAKTKEALQADLSALEKSAKDIGDTLTAYDKAYPQLNSKYTLLRDFVNGQKEQLEAKLPADLVAWIGRKAAALNDLIDRAGKRVGKAEWRLQEHTTDYEGKKTAAALAQKRFDYWKSSPKPYDDLLKLWQARRAVIEQLRESDQQLPLAYLQTLLLEGRLVPPYTTAELKDKLRAKWADLSAALKTRRHALIDFGTATANLDTARKELELLLSQGVEDIMRELPDPEPDPAASAPTAKR